MGKRTLVSRPFKGFDNVTKENLGSLTIFEHVKRLAGGKRRNLSWYRDTTRMVCRQKDLYSTMSTLDESLGPIPGEMYLFEYDAVYAARLPYYDEFPLVYALSMGNPFLGLNLHYLGLKHRMQFIADLELRNTINFPPQCFHSYLFEGLNTPLYRVPREDYKTAIFLPIEKFVSRKGGGYRNVSRQLVWNEGLYK